MLNLIAMQFGVQIDPGILALMMSAPTCLQPSFTIESNGRIRLAAQDKKPEDDESTPPESPKVPPTGPGGPPHDPNSKTLYHGSREGLVDGKFDLEQAQAKGDT